MNNEHLKKYKNIHKNKRVFIIGNGPSLNQTNLDLIKDEISIGMNRIPILYNKTVWRPNYYVFCSMNVIHSTWGKKWRDSIIEAVTTANTLGFIWTKYKEPIVNGNAEKLNVEWFDNMTEKGAGREGSFSKDISEYMDKSGTTMNVAFQIAAYMGFKQIIVLGADVSWVSSSGIDGDPNHFDDSYQAHIANGEKDRAETRKTHALVYKCMKELDIEVYNGTVNTFLDIYPLIDYKKVINNPNWKGNNKDEDTEEIKEKRNKITEYWKTNQYIG